MTVRHSKGRREGSYSKKSPLCCYPANKLPSLQLTSTDLFFCVCGCVCVCVCILTEIGYTDSTKSVSIYLSVFLSLSHFVYDTHFLCNALSLNIVSWRSIHFITQWVSSVIFVTVQPSLFWMYRIYFTTILLLGS